MTKTGTALAVVVFALGSAAFAASTTAPARPAAAPKAPAAPVRATGVVSLSLVEALAAMHQPQLAGIFSFVAEPDAPFALADFLARDKKLMKLYLNKLEADRKVANGLTDWDHQVCASLVNLYSSPMAGTFGVPDAKRMSQINQCVLAPVIPLEQIVLKRKE